MTLNDILMVTDHDVTIKLYERDNSHYMGAMKPLYALKCLASNFRSLEVKEVRGGNYDCKLSVFVSTREEK